MSEAKRDVIQKITQEKRPKGMSGMRIRQTIFIKLNATSTFVLALCWCVLSLPHFCLPSSTAKVERQKKEAKKREKKRGERKALRHTENLSPTVLLCIFLND